MIKDRLGRPLLDLRVSVTDRCNYRCPYCMPRAKFGPGYAFLPRSEVLSFEEIVRVVDALVPMGLQKVRLTGGEPLLRRDLGQLVEQLAKRPLDLCLTTNGALLPAHAGPLRAAGLRRVTVSLDALDTPTFAALSDSDVPPEQVLAGVNAALAAGLGVKVNAVVKRGVNEHAVVELVEAFRGTPVEVRFIEYMDVGATNGWRRDDVVTADEI